MLIFYRHYFLFRSRFFWSRTHAFVIILAIESHYQATTANKPDAKDYYDQATTQFLDLHYQLPRESMAAGFRTLNRVNSSINAL